MDGFETAAMIHEHPRFANTPIIFVTGVHHSELDRLKGYRLGAVDYVAIPIVPEILRGKVSVLVELYIQRQTLRSLNKHLAEVNLRLEEAHRLLQKEKTRELETLNRDLMDSNGRLASANAALQLEIEERGRAEEALKQADRRKDEFLAILSHELRNPLAPMRNAVEIMRQVNLSDARLDFARQVIDRQLTHLTRLMEDLLDISRVTRDTIQLQREQVDAQLVVRRAIETLQPVIRERGHRLHVQYGAAPMTVWGDPVRLVQVVGNLLSNAAKYTPDGGDISISAGPEEGQVVIRVKDNGVGLAQESIPRLFSLFSRVAHRESTAQEGLGVGLALVRKLVQMHGGEVIAVSEGLQRGSEFIVRLPEAMDEAPEGTAQALNAAGKAAAAAAEARAERQLSDSSPPVRCAPP